MKRFSRRTAHLLAAAPALVTLLSFVAVPAGAQVPAATPAIPSETPVAAEDILPTAPREELSLARDAARSAAEQAGQKMVRARELEASARARLEAKKSDIEAIRKRIDAANKEKDEARKKDLEGQKKTEEQKLRLWERVHEIRRAEAQFWQDWQKAMQAEADMSERALELSESRAGAAERTSAGSSEEMIRAGRELREREKKYLEALKAWGSARQEAASRRKEMVERQSGAYDLWREVMGYK